MSGADDASPLDLTHVFAEPAASPEAAAPGEHDLNSLRVEDALRRLQKSWLNRYYESGAVERDLDELDVAIGLWLERPGAERS